MSGFCLVLFRVISIYFILSESMISCKNETWENSLCIFRARIFKTFGKTNTHILTLLVPSETTEIQGLRNDEPGLFISVSTYSNVSQIEKFLQEQLQDDLAFNWIYIIARNMQDFFRVLNKIQESGLLKDVLRWMPILYIECSQKFSKDMDIFQLKEDLSYIKFPLDSSIFLVLNVENEQLIWETYFINNLSFIHKLSLHDKYLYETSLRRQNFQGAIVRVTGVDDEENQNIVSYKKDTFEFDTGSSVSLLLDLRDSLNFTVQAMKDENYISELPNGNLAGIGKQLQDEEADLSIPLSYILPYRRRHLTSLHPLCVDKILVFFKQPQASSVRNIYGQPFSRKLWGVLWSVWFILLTSIFVYNYVAVRNFLEETNFEQPILWAVALQCQQGWHALTTTYSGRIIHLCGLWTGLVSFIAYSASIISALTAPVEPVRSFSELRKINYVLLADPLIHYGTYLADANSPADEITKLLEQNYVNEKDSVQKVFQGGHAFINTLDFFSPLSWSLGFKDHQICDKISWVSLDSVILSNAFYVKKGSPFKEIFNLRILFSIERGLNTRYINNLYKETRVHCVRRRKSFQEQLGIPDVFTAFAILSIGITCALVFLLVEKLYFRRSRSRIYQK